MCWFGRKDIKVDDTLKSQNKVDDTLKSQNAALLAALHSREELIALTTENQSLRCSLAAAQAELRKARCLLAYVSGYDQNVYAKAIANCSKHSHT